MRTNRNTVYWYFQADDLLSNESSTAWVRYRDIEMQIIEDAYQEDKIEVFLDNYRIDLKKLIQFSQSDSTQQCAVRRDIDCRLEENIREERFFSELLLTSTRSCGSAQAWCPFLTAWLDSPTGRRALIDCSSSIDACADGILQEAKQSKSDSITEAEWMVKQLFKCKTKSRLELTKTCINLYTRESFLYRVLNAALRNNDHSKIATLGPLCFLIQDYSRTCKGFVGTLYRGMQLSLEQILTYEQAVGSWHTWSSFTSTSKSRKIASLRGNVLFIITITNTKFNTSIRGLDITEISHIPDEEEVLLPVGFCFQIISVKEDPLQKYIIELKI